MQFFRKITQIMLLLGASVLPNDKAKIGYFETCLEYGSPANKWFDGLTIPDELIQNLKSWKLSTDTLGQKVESGGKQVYSHVDWANGLVSRADDAGDKGHMLLSEVYGALPGPVCYKPRGTYKELAAAVREIAIPDLLDELRRFCKDEETARLAREPPISPTKALRTALNATHIHQPAPPRPYPQAQRGNYGGNPFMAPGGSRGGLYFARGGPPRPAGTGRGGGAPGRPSLRGRLIADRYRDLKANSSPPVPDTDEGRAAYRTQVSAWMRTNSGFEPDEQHPYPLSPGTSAAGTNECFRCGKGGHRSVVCQAPPMPGLEQRWRSIATYITREWTAAERAQVIEPRPVMTDAILATSQTLAIPKLRDDGSNWADYEPRTKRAMGAKGLLAHLEGRARQPTPLVLISGVYSIDGISPATEEQIEAKEKKIADYEQRENMAQHLILSSTSSRLSNTLLKLTTAQAMWEEVKRDATTVSKLTQVDILNQLQNMR
ncbi:hypothetical protein PLICRDRAFT_181167, partial [Plicaturopsis crispa FD-325 SS-3]